jgi:hypothetical protein
MWSNITKRDRPLIASASSQGSVGHRAAMKQPLRHILSEAKARREKCMANENLKLQSGDVSDEVVSQVSKAAVQILRLRQSLEQEIATAQTDEEREAINDQVSVAAVQAIGEQGLTVDVYNEVIAAAQSDPELEERVLVACRSL